MAMDCSHLPPDATQESWPQALLSIVVLTTGAVIAMWYIGS
jgi:hypothetical protein